MREFAVKPTAKSIETDREFVNIELPGVKLIGVGQRYGRITKPGVRFTIAALSITQKDEYIKIIAAHVKWPRRESILHKRVKSSTRGRKVGVTIAGLRSNGVSIMKIMSSP